MNECRACWPTSDYAMWLDAKLKDPAAWQHLLALCGECKLMAKPIGMHVNKVANDDPHYIEVQRSMF